MKENDMFNKHSVEIDWGGRPLKLETGKVARQADGSEHCPHQQEQQGTINPVAAHARIDHFVVEKKLGDRVEVGEVSQSGGSHRRQQAPGGEHGKLLQRVLASAPKRVGRARARLLS